MSKGQRSGGSYVVCFTKILEDLLVRIGLHDDAVSSIGDCGQRDGRRYVILLAGIKLDGAAESLQENSVVDRSV